MNKNLSHKSLNIHHILIFAEYMYVTSCCATIELPLQFTQNEVKGSIHRSVRYSASQKRLKSSGGSVFSKGKLLVREYFPFVNLLNVLNR
jgi:hypothetical protein